jgi:hypothetical protein
MYGIVGCDGIVKSALPGTEREQPCGAATDGRMVANWRHMRRDVCGASTQVVPAGRLNYGCCP